MNKVQLNGHHSTNNREYGHIQVDLGDPSCPLSGSARISSAQLAATTGKCVVASLGNQIRDFVGLQKPFHFLL